MLPTRRCAAVRFLWLIRANRVSPPDGESASATTVYVGRPEVFVLVYGLEHISGFCLETATPTSQQHLSNLRLFQFEVASYLPRIAGPAIPKKLRL